MTLEVVHRHEELAPESSFELMAPISGVGFWSVCQGPNDCWLIRCYSSRCTVADIKRFSDRQHVAYTYVYVDWSYMLIVRVC